MATIAEPESSPQDEKRRQKSLSPLESADVEARSIDVHKLCEELGVSLLSLAERSGIGLKRLQAIYLGQWTPNPQERAAIAGALDTPCGDIAWDHNTPVEHFYGPG